MSSFKRTWRVTSRRLVLWLPLIWLLALCLGYILMHYPGHPRLFSGFSPVFASFDAALVQAALLRHVQTLLGVLVVWAASAAVGTRLLSISDLFSPLERTALRLLAGLAVVSVVGLILGLFGAYPPVWAAWLGFVLASALFWKHLRIWLRDVQVGWQTITDIQMPMYIRVLRWGCLALIILTLLMALAPPTKWDSLTYHLAGPQAYLEAGRIIPMPENHFLGFPQLVETHFLWQLLIATPQAAVLMHATFGMAMLTLVLGFASRLGYIEAGWVAVALLLFGETIWASFHWPYNDLGLMAYATAAFLLILRWAEADFDFKLLIIAGAFTGCAVACKYTAGGATIGLGLLALWLARRNGLFFAFRSAATLAALALIVFAPWMLKNFILYQNPVAPFATGTPGFDELDQWYYLRPWTGYIAQGEPFDWAGFFFAPLQWSIFGYDGISPYMANVSPLIVGLLPFMALGWKQRPAEIRELVKYAAVFIIPAYLFWLYGSTVSWYLIQTRLLFGVFPLLAFLSGLALVGLKDIQLSVNPLRATIPVVLIIGGMALVNSMLEVLEENPLYFIVGTQSQEEYLLASGTGTHYFAIQQINALPAGSKVQFLWEPRTYYCDTNVICSPDSLINMWWHARQTTVNPREIAQTWVSDGATHVLVFEAGRTFLFEEEPYEPVTRADQVAFDSLRGPVLEELWAFEGEYTLYQINHEALAPQ